MTRISQLSQAQQYLIYYPIMEIPTGIATYRGSGDYTEYHIKQTPS